MKIKINLFVYLIFSAITLLIFISLSGCGGNSEFGIGPVKEEMKLEPVNDQLVLKGKQIFDTKCISCHKFDVRLVGPPMKDVTKRRRPEWIMNMMLNPVEMTQKDKVAKELFTQYLIQMTFQDVSFDDARAMLDYFRAIDENKIQP